MSILRFTVFALIILVSACKDPIQPKNRKIQDQGETMGTYFRVIYLDHRSFKPQIEKLLEDINNQMSTYISNSSISQINQSKKMFESNLSSMNHFLPVFKSAQQVYTNTEGSFDPTVMPLVNYWGFGYTEKKIREANTKEIDSLRQLLGFDAFKIKVAGQSVSLQKEKPLAQLDFSAIAKGYAVDQIARLLESKDIQNYLVDIGGEVSAKGKNERGAYWTVGINTPKPEAKTKELQQIISLQNKSIASSGNYRNFHEKDGKKYGHTINPKTGMPELNQLLGVSIIANDCMTADAYATASMVMGLDKAYKMISSNSELEGYFIYGNDNGELEVKYTSALKPLLLK